MPAPPSFLRRQLELYLTAQMFYTRLPCPAWIGHAPELLNRATVYFPLIGWVVGGAAALVYLGAAQLWPPAVALLLSTTAGVLVTGAFHEDGLADVCDGFGGGWTSGKILEIMKDSRVGTYGVVGLGLTLAAKLLVLHTAATGPAGGLLPVLALLLVAHPLSRLLALSFVYTMPYARENDLDSKAKPVAQGLSRAQLAGAAAWGLLPLLAYVAWRGQPALLLVLLPLLILHVVLRRWFQRWINGYTGDCLGAAQQLSEVVIYLFFTLRIWL